MTEREPNLSRAGRQKSRKRSSNMLNILIGVVVLLILVVATTIFLGNDSDEKADDNGVLTTDDGENGATNPDQLSEEDREEDGQIGDEDDSTIEDDNKVVGGNSSDSSSGKEPSKLETETNTGDEDTEGESDNSGSVTYANTDEAIIGETIINASWEPIGTTQSGEHVSLYDGKSVDWEEKKQALAYATGLPQDTMLFLKIKNGGGPQKSVGIVSSRDSKEKYRVYLEWVDEQGWKPVKMDVLTTLDFEY